MLGVSSCCLSSRVSGLVHRVLGFKAGGLQVPDFQCVLATTSTLSQFNTGTVN